MTKQEAVIKYIEDNYLHFNRLRHDVVSDKLQLRMDVRSDRPSGLLEGRPSEGLLDRSLHSLLDNSKNLTMNNVNGLTESEANDLTAKHSNSSPRERSVWREMTKHDINSIVCHCAQECDVNITSREVMTALQSDLIPDVHPLREYILSLPSFTPDQPDWIDWVAQQVRVVDTTQSYSTSTQVSAADQFWRSCFKKWFVAMVASWMRDDIVNHQILVLIGKQGIYKTTWLEHLIPPHLRAYACKLANSNDLNKDERLRIAEFGLISLDEIDSMNNRELNQLKSIITATDVNERAAYAYTKERRVRLASFCASGNRRDFLTDITGNRRWLPFEVESIQNPFHAIIPYEQLYAQAVYLIEQGWYMYWFDLEEIEELEKHNEEFRAMENEEQLIPILFDIPAEGKGEFMTTAEISDKLVSYGGIKKPMSLRQLGMLLAKRGFQKKQVYLSGSNVRGWIVYKRHTDEIELLKKIDSHSATSQPTNLY